MQAMNTQELDVMKRAAGALHFEHAVAGLFSETPAMDHSLADQRLRLDSKDRNKEGNSPCSNSSKRHLHLDDDYQKRDRQRGLGEGFIQMPRSPLPPPPSIGKLYIFCSRRSWGREDMQDKRRTPTPPYINQRLPWLVDRRRLCFVMFSSGLWMTRG